MKEKILVRKNVNSINDLYDVKERMHLNVFY